MEIIEEKVKRFWIVESNWSYNKYQIKHNRPGIKTLDEKRYTSTKIYKVIFTKEELETFEAEWRNKYKDLKHISDNICHEFNFTNLFNRFNTDKTLNFNDNVFGYYDKDHYFFCPIRMKHDDEKYGRITYTHSNLPQNEFAVEFYENTCLIIKKQDFEELKLNKKELKYLDDINKKEAETKVIDTFLAHNIQTCIEKYGMIYEKGAIRMSCDWRIAKEGIQNLLKETVLKDLEQAGFEVTLYKRSNKLESGTYISDSIKISKTISIG